ncbi:MAG: NAD(P)/FAD-dependent oxidoreductase, partial [Bilophila wadsworthia]
THTVENVPSYKSIHGKDLMTACREHVESLGVAIEEVNEVEEVRLDGQPKEIRTSEGDSFTADVVIIATGRKPIPLPVETAFEKVHYCSVCDGTAYKDKDVLVVGGGNSGFDESLYLAGLGVRSVHIVEMFPACAAAQSTQDRALATSIIRANVNTTITALDPLPDGRCRASLRDAASGAASEETVDGVFCFIGQKPNTALLEGLIDMEKGYIRTDEDMRTSLPGVFAVGDVRAKRYRQITTAMGDGTVAALEAERFIRSLR